jgi:hypothetical protein
MLSRADVARCMAVFLLRPTRGRVQPPPAAGDVLGRAADPSVCEVDQQLTGGESRRVRPASLLSGAAVTREEIAVFLAHLQLADVEPRHASQSSPRARRPSDPRRDTPSGARAQPGKGWTLDTSVPLQQLAPSPQILDHATALRAACLADSNDSRPPPAEPLTLFDVPSGHWAKQWIETSAAASGGVAGNFCPAAAITRDPGAVFLLRESRRSHIPAPPAPCSMMCRDHWATAWIELARGAAGCGSSLFCPEGCHSRSMARSCCAEWASSP